MHVRHLGERPNGNPFAEQPALHDPLQVSRRFVQAYRS